METKITEGNLEVKLPTTWANENLKSDGSAIFPPGLSHVCGSHSIVTSVGMLIRTNTARADMEASCHTQTSHPALTVAALSFCHHLYKHVSHPPQVTNLTVFSVLLVRLLITYLLLHLHLWCTFLIHSVISTHGPSVALAPFSAALC